MKQFLICTFLLNSLFLFAQNSQLRDSIEQPKYDTTSIEIQLRSTNSFYFCNKLYKIPDDCPFGKATNCCTYDTRVTNDKRQSQFGTLNCYGNSALSWFYFDSLSMAQFNFENQKMKGNVEQYKTFHKEAFKLLVDGQEVIAYKLDYTTYQNDHINEIRFYGNINGQAVMGTIHNNNNGSAQSLSSSKDMSQFFQQIFKF